LFLLGTWSGRGVEVWNPASSNVLQVVLSIQGLILGISEPYFLEAGYEKQRGTAFGRKCSMLYNENALLMSLQALIMTANNPPRHFEALIETHFSKHTEMLLTLIQQYLNLTSIGGDSNQNETPQEETNQNTSTDIDDGMKYFGVPFSPVPSLGFLKTLQLLFQKLQNSRTSTTTTTTSTTSD